MCFWVSVTLDDHRTQSLWRRWSPQTSESVENWPLWVQKRFWSKHQNFEFPQNSPCSSYKSSDWSQSLISESLEVLEGSMSVQNRAKYILHTLRPKTNRLWDIWSRFVLIFVSVVLHVMTQMHVSAGSSHSIWSPQTVFTDFWVSMTLDNCWMQSLWRRWSPRASKSVENWCVWVRIRFWSKSQKINNQFCLSDFSKRFKDIRFH